MRVVERVVSLLVVLFLSISCNEIKGKLEVSSNFLLTDENGSEVEISVGVHKAELSYDVKRLEMELEIKRIDGDADRDFIFTIPEDLQGVDPARNSLEAEVSATESNQGVNLSISMRSEVVSHEGPYEDHVRCVSYSFPAYKTVVYNLITRQAEATVTMSDSQGDLAVFRGQREIKERQETYQSECEGYRSNWGSDDWGYGR